MDSEASQKTAIVVGAGVGGVATAARLAKAGFKVTVVEKNDFTGGRCSLIHHEGYRFDQGPSLLLLPSLFRETFADLDTSLEKEGVELLKCDPNYTLHYPSSDPLILSSDLATMYDTITHHEGSDGFTRYLAFLREAHAHYHLSVQHVLHRDFNSLFAMMRPSFLRHLLTLHPFESIYARASRYFKTEVLRRAFTFGSMYMGMSPFDAPGTYSLLQYTELVEGIWYPKGGFHKVVEALVKVGERLGVEYRLSTPISRILLSDDRKRAIGVLLDSGEIMEADVVICNADLVYAYNNLLPFTPSDSTPSKSTPQAPTPPNKPPSSSYAASLSSRSSSCSSISFYWSLSTTIPSLTAHNIFLASAYRDSFDDIFKSQLIPSEPSFYLNVPSRIDDSAAPAGKDAIVVLVPVGHLLESGSDEHRGMEGDGEEEATTQDWDAMVNFARIEVLKMVKERTGTDLEPLIVNERVNTPKDWKSIFNLDKGAILGLSHSFFNVLCFRPSACHSWGGRDFGLGWLIGGLLSLLGYGGGVANLYFVGASAHPGTGVPICLAGGRLVAEQVLRDLEMETPWGGVDWKIKEKGTETPVDDAAEAKKDAVVLIWEDSKKRKQKVWKDELLGDRKAGLGERADAGEKGKGKEGKDAIGEKPVDAAPGNDQESKSKEGQKEGGGLDMLTAIGIILWGMLLFWFVRSGQDS
ncbi:phytoene desaturase [Aulographum hederae CBS 113979]|uniref:Phytoene desaturase n=1 Tax=Aulographum hederae CBS 113979 TaxID=1176131 RepID=A0A6G1GSZ5_9PEZI|nr:phytoene desaturase [Aulographum hederae CBS 113979]